MAPLLLAFVAAFTCAQALSCAQEACAARFARYRVGELRRALLDVVFSGAGRLSAHWQTGALVATATEGLDLAEGYLRLCLPRTAALAGTGGLLLLAVFACDAVSGAVLLAALPVIAMFMVMLGRAASEQARASRAAFERMGNGCVDALYGVETLLAFDAERGEERRVFAESEKLRVATVATLKTATLSHAVLDAVSTLAVAGVAMLLATRLLDGSAGLETALFVFLLAPQVLAPVRALASDFHATLDGRTALAAVEAAVAAGGQEGRTGAGDAENAAGAGGVADAGITADNVGGMAGAGEAQGAGTRGGWGAGSTLRVEGLCFAYDEEEAGARGAGVVAGAAGFGASAAAGTAGAGAADSAAAAAGTVGADAAADSAGGCAAAPPRLALADVAFTLYGFERVALIGASGAGKSTLARLLAGLAQPSGSSFELDGRALSSLQGPLWRDNLLYIPQDPHIFSASVRDNVVFYAPDASDGAVERAVERAGLAGLVARMPQGLDTQVGDGGRGLSGGQAQRIALARAFLDGRRRILVLDEPTAHLDIETELELKERMMPLMEGRLVVFATHRLHWLAEMDRAIVLDGGRVAGVCACDELRDPAHPLHGLVFGAGCGGR